MNIFHKRQGQVDVYFTLSVGVLTNRNLNGYATQTQILKIEQGKTLDEEVKMVKE